MKPAAVVTMREFVSLTSSGAGTYTGPLSAFSILPWLKGVVTNNFDVVKWHQIRFRPVLYTVAPSFITPAGLLYGFSVGQTAPNSLMQIQGVQESNFQTSRPWASFDIKSLEQPNYDTGSTIGFVCWGRSDGTALTSLYTITFEFEYRVTLSSPS